MTSLRQVRSPSKKTEFGQKGFMHMENNKVFIHVKYDGKTYFVYVKSLKDLLNGVKSGAYVFGYK